MSTKILLKKINKIIVFLLLTTNESVAMQFEPDCGRGDLHKQHKCLMYKAIKSNDALLVKKLMNTPYVNPNEKGIISTCQKLTYIGCALFHSNQYDPKSLVKALIDGGSDPNTTNIIGLTIAMYIRDAATLKLLLNNGLNPNINYLQSGEKYLHHSSVCGFYNGKEISRTLLEHGADANIRDPKGRTPIMYLANRIGFTTDVPEYCFEIVSLLKHYGANLNIVDNYDRAAIDYSYIFRDTYYPSRQCWNGPVFPYHYKYHNSKKQMSDRLIAQGSRETKYKPPIREIGCTWN